MKILVPIKRVLDYRMRVKINNDNSGVDLSNTKMSMNPFDEIALEEALRLKEKNIAHEIILVSIDNEACKEQLLHGLAMGADRAILVATEQPLTPLDIAEALVKIVAQTSPHIILMGKQAIDNDQSQIPQMLAAKLNLPQATFISNLEICDNKATATREIDEGLETLQLALPAVISTDLRLNTPRRATLPNIIKAKTKPIELIKFNELGVSLCNDLEVVRVFAAEKRKSGKEVKSVAELVTNLHNLGVL